MCAIRKTKVIRLRSPQNSNYEVATSLTDGAIDVLILAPDEDPISMSGSVHARSISSSIGDPVPTIKTPILAMSPRIDWLGFATIKNEDSSYQSLTIQQQV